MTKFALKSSDVELINCDWPQRLNDLAYAYGKPNVIGKIKQSPTDFIVTEVMTIEPSGEGEHYWLDITKTRLNTDAVAKSLARFSGVSNRDVGYSGMKDFNAVTRQWFSVWKPKGHNLDWGEYALDGVTINQVTKHTRKIKRGTHTANHFKIRILGLSGVENIKQNLDSRLDEIRLKGVPNYFGEQRFGRNVNNLPQVCDMFLGGKRVKDRNLRGILLSSARSWLFNSVVSARVKAKTWQSLYAGEPANLDGTNSVFRVTNVAAENARAERLDIHPTAPLWGQRSKEDRCGLNACDALNELESMAMEDYALLQKGLEAARIEYQRRATRLAPSDVDWFYDQECVTLSFKLQRGQFATSVLRELISTL